MPVSAIEKKPETTSRTASAMSCAANGMSFKRSARGAVEPSPLLDHGKVFSIAQGPFNDTRGHVPSCSPEQGPSRLICDGHSSESAPQDDLEHEAAADVRQQQR